MRLPTTLPRRLLLASIPGMTSLPESSDKLGHMGIDSLKADDGTNWSGALGLMRRGRMYLRDRGRRFVCDSQIERSLSGIVVLLKAQ